jgi:SAM-dependent methyltransferase
VNQNIWTKEAAKNRKREREYKLMPFRLEELHNADQAYRQFLSRDPPAHHARYIFPFFAGTYFGYRKVDVLRVVAIARAAEAAIGYEKGKTTSDPSYLDVGCGYGDFLKRIRELMPSASGIEKEAGIFYAFGKSKPSYIEILPVESFSNQVDVAFVGWMEPGADFRSKVAKIAKHVIITTFDSGGQCGINGGCEYEEFGFEQVAWWRTPSWIDVNAELMNRYYTPSISEEKKRQLAELRSAHNFWYVYARPKLVDKVKEALLDQVAKEEREGKRIERYDFEDVLDECGFGYKQEIPTVRVAKRLWDVIFN